MGALAQVRRLAGAGRLSHAYLLTGPAGSGKHELARTLAAALVCTGAERPCGACPHCKKVLAGIHPDVTTLSPADGKKEIVVEQVRRIRGDAYVRPNEAARKVYLIDPASALNPSAQNALLKVLEEGPPYVAFLLLSESAGSLLPTVRSRCEQLSLRPSSEAPAQPSPEAEELADLLSGGSESALQRRCVSLEKLDRESLCALLTETVQALEARVRADPARARDLLPKLDLLKRLGEAGQFNVSSGHLAGWLCAAVFRK